MPRESVKERSETKIKIPKRYKVLFYNDDFTPMEFVVLVLNEIFEKDYNEAVKLMLEIYHSTCAVVGVYTRDIARTKAKHATDWARREGYPLKVEAVAE